MTPEEVAQRMIVPPAGVRVSIHTAWRRHVQKALETANKELERCDDRDREAVFLLWRIQSHYLPENGDEAKRVIQRAKDELLQSAKIGRLNELHRGIERLMAQSFSLSLRVVIAYANLLDRNGTIPIVREIQDEIETNQGAKIERPAFSSVRYICHRDGLPLNPRGHQKASASL
jgi:hypothetical protein